MKGYIIYATDEIIDNHTVVQLFGRLENGQSFATINKFKPYFYIKKKDAIEYIRRVSFCFRNVQKWNPVIQI